MWEEGDGVRTQGNAGEGGGVYFFHGSILFCGCDHRLDTCLPFGQQVVRHVSVNRQL